MSSTTVYVRQLLSPREATRKRRTLARLGVASESTPHGDMVCVTFALPPTVSLSGAPKPSTPPPPRPTHSETKAAASIEPTTLHNHEATGELMTVPGNV